MPIFRLERILFNIAAWLRRRTWLTPIYRLLPLGWRIAALNRTISITHGSLLFGKTPAWSRGAEVDAPLGEFTATRVSPIAGVNIFGFLRGEFGIAESARLYARALIEGGYSVALNDIDLELEHDRNDRSLDHLISDRAPYPDTIIFVNPDFLIPVLKSIGLERLAGHRIIACWFWELEAVPQAWLPALDLVDEIIVASSFIESAFLKVTSKPILRVPLPLCSAPDSGLQRVDFGLEDGKFIFLCMFDFHSSIERKNPFGAIAAFKLAFHSGRDDVRLLIKSSGGKQAPADMARLLEAVGEDSRILIRDEVIARSHLQALQRCCDAYVSLHRAEGFGLGMAECMALGKPVIATGWSGNMDFMSAENSLLIDYVLVPVQAGDYPHSHGARWAEPNHSAAAAAMLRLVDQPDLARSLGAKASAVTEQLSPISVATTLGAWLDHAERRYQTCVVTNSMDNTQAVT